jgi:hypothetical protein
VWWGEYSGCATGEGTGKSPIDDEALESQAARETCGGVNTVAVPLERGRESPLLMTKLESQAARETCGGVNTVAVPLERGRESPLLIEATETGV